MPTEIERKFLVNSNAYRNEATSKTQIKQGYLSSLPARTVRVRIKGKSGFLTIKGAPDATGTSRYEWERKIPLKTAEELFNLCEPGRIDKTRYLVNAGDFTFEVDEFHGENQGLTIAEIELRNADDPFEKPVWLGTEVTGDPKYYNSSLIRKPFTRW